jgi:TIR domain
VEEPAGHAFISYVREDARYVDQLQRVLEAAGFSVWRDTADLWPGEDWRMKIRRAITDNALVFIACFSSRSAARTTSYQYEELTLAVDQLRLRRPDVPWLIPVRFDDCAMPDVEIGGGRTLASIQRADLFGRHRDEGIARLLTAVQRLLGQGTPRTRRHGKVTEGDQRRTCFSIGNLDTTMLVVEGDGEQVIGEHNVRVVVDPEPVVLPSEMQAWRAEILREHEQRAKAAHQHFWNGLNYAVSKFSVARTVPDEEPEIFFRLKPSDYGNFLASQQLDRRFDDGTTPRGLCKTLLIANERIAVRNF